MNRLLATVRTNDHARITQLEKAFPGHEFEIVPHETRFQINLTNAHMSLDQPTLDKMVRMASGAEPTFIGGDVSKDPKATGSVSKGAGSTPQGTVNRTAPGVTPSV